MFKPPLVNIHEKLNRIDEEWQPAEPIVGRVTSSLELLRAVYMDPGQPLAARLRAALGAIPFEHPRLTLTAQLQGLGDRIDEQLKERLERNAQEG